MEAINNNPDECIQQLKLYSEELGRGKKWAMEMFDAWAKPQSAILTGNIMHIGSYDECLKINATVDQNQIKGQYCTAMWSPSENYGEGLAQILGQVNINKSRLEAESYITDLKRSYGICVPAACTVKDLNNIANIVEEKLKLPLHFEFLEDYCKSDEERPMTSAAIAAFVVFGVFGLIILASTLYDALFYQKTKDKKTHLYVAFSLYSNAKRLLTTSSSENDLNCLNGIRVISMMWIVLGHRYMFTFFMPIVNALHLLWWLDRTENVFILAGTIAVDTFFVISGLLIVYMYLKSKEKGSQLSWPMFYLHRILRLTPSLAMVVLFSGTLTSYFCTGPLCPVIYNFTQEACEKYWWSTLIYLQNYLNPNEQCVGQSWYLAVDMQLYFLSPLLLISLIKWPKSTIVTSLFVALASCVYVFAVTWTHELGSIFLDQTNEQFAYNYSQTHTRASVWIIGAICGYIIFQYRNKQIRLTKLSVLILWGLALGIMLGIMFSHIVFVRNEYNAVKSAFFNSLTKPAWALALSLIIFLCAKGYGGLINKFLSCSVFNILIRINYNVYLLHMLVIIFLLMQERTQNHFRNIEVLHQFWGDYVFTLAAAMLWTLAFESPITLLEKIIFRKRNKSSSNEVAVNGCNNNIPKIFNNKNYTTSQENFKIQINSYHKIDEP